MSFSRNHPAIAEIPAGAAPAVVLQYNFWSSLYHRVVRQARDFRLSGRTGDSGWTAAVERVAALYVPLGPFSWLEPPLSHVDSEAALRTVLNDRASWLAGELAEALASVADDYERGLWKADRDTLDQSLRELHSSLHPVKDDLLATLGRLLGLELGEDPFEVLLVPICHEPVGAYSHPTVIGVDRFKGMSLVEVVLHELSHVAASRALPQANGGFAAIRTACKRLGRTEHFALELFHLIIFHASGQLVRSVLEPGYATLASRRNIYDKLGAKLGSRLTENDVQIIWNRRERGTIGLGVVVDELYARLNRRD